MILSHTVHQAPGATPTRWAFLLHGFLGQGRNWTTIARRLVAARPEWAVVTPDLRLHGRSQGATPPHDVAACARDLSALEGHLGIRVSAALGHSFGGKVAMRWSMDRPGLSQLWILDSTPRAMPPTGEAVATLARLRRIETPAPSRDSVVKALIADGVGPGEAAWVASNLTHRPDGFVWGIDLDALEALLATYFEADLWPAVEHPPEGLSIHVVQATESDVLTPGDLARLREAGAAHGHLAVHPLKSGHWVHTGDPDGLLALLLDSF